MTNTVNNVNTNPQETKGNVAQNIEQAQDDKTFTPVDDVDYTPVFSVRARYFIYLAGLLWGVVFLILSTLSGDLAWPKWAVDLVAQLAPVGPSIAAAFGVHYAGIDK